MKASTLQRSATSTQFWFGAPLLAEGRIIFPTSVTNFIPTYGEVHGNKWFYSIHSCVPCIIKKLSFENFNWIHQIRVERSHFPSDNEKYGKLNKYGKHYRRKVFLLSQKPYYFIQLLVMNSSPRVRWPMTSTNMAFDITYLVLDAVCDLLHDIGSYDFGDRYRCFGDWYISINNGLMQLATLNVPDIASRINMYVLDSRC